MARIIVVGGSLGGLMAANLLARAGHAVQVLEKAPASLDGRGAGIVTHRPLLATLADCGVKVDTDLGIAVKGRVALDQGGCPIDSLEMPQILTSWSRLYALLIAAFKGQPYLHGVTVTSVAQSAHGATVLCGDGRTFEADLVVASDGIRSAVRAQLLPDSQPHYAGYIAWRGICEEADLSEFTRQSVFERFGFGLPPGEQLIGYPVAGAGHAVRAGQRRYNYVWYRPAADDHLRQLMTDADGHYFEQGIPPHKVAAQHVTAMRLSARALLAPQFAEMIDKTAQPFLQPIYDCTSASMAFGRVALMGDAAFVARPHVGMGVTKAAEDAAALAQSIAALGATPAALQAFEAGRLGPCQAVVQRGRDLGAYLQSHRGSAPSRPHCDSSSAQRARQVMLETAVDLSALPTTRISALSC